MTTVRVVITLLIASLLLEALAQGAPFRSAGPLEIAVERVVVGDKGHAITAGAGNSLERFDIEVLGVLESGGNGFPLLLVRASGALIQSSGGVAAGMSGSPVYLETEQGPALAGAIGYVFPDAVDTVALVTPIAAMRAAATGGSALGTLALTLPGYGQAQPVATPLLLAGAGERAAALLQPLFQTGRVALLPVQAGGTASAGSDADFEVVPGSAVAVSLISGDVLLSAVGTVTAVDGDGILAFGHPFLEAGRTALPFVPAYVTAIIASRSVPFKLANVGARVLGTIQQDRPAALAGRLGMKPPTIAVTLTFVGVPGSPRYQFQVAADDHLYPSLVATGALQLIDRTLAATHGGFADLAWEIGLAGGEQLNVLEQVNHPSDIALAAARLAGGPLALLAGNEFRQASVERIGLNVRLDERQRVASLEEAVLEATEVTAGGAAHVHLRLQPYRQPAVVRTVTVPLPADLEGPLTLLLRGGSVPRDTGDERLDERKVDAPRSFGELLDALRSRVQASELVVEALTAEGELLRLARAPFPFVIDGHEKVELTLLAPPGSDAPDGPGAEPLE